MKIGFIGGGKMAEAMIGSLLHGRVVQAHEVFVGDPAAVRRRLLKSQFGVNAYSRNRAIPGSVDMLVLAVKPQDLREALEELASGICDRHLVMSIAAGKTLAFLEGLLPTARVVRVMPNLACQVSEGMSVFCLGARATDADRRMSAKVLSSFGLAMELPESQFDAVTALSGSGPAFLSYMLDAMAAAAAAEGMTREDAVTLARQTMLGTARILAERGTSPAELMAAVASPGGTTAAGLKVLERSVLKGIIARTIGAAAARSRELSK